MLAEAEACPALIGRSEKPSKVAKPRVGGAFPAMALLSDPALDIRQYLEDLVTIAVGSAQQAEDMSVQAREASRKARRGMAVVAGFGALGLVVGVAGFAASRSANVRLTEVREQVSTLQNMQRQAQNQLADIAARTPDEHDVAEAAPPPTVAPAAVVTQPVPAAVESQPVPAASRSPFRYYSEPWPDSRPPPQHRVYTWHSSPSASSRPAAVPQFVAEFQRNLRAIFR